jgi:hypothetical protein
VDRAQRRAQVERSLHALYIANPHATLRDEDSQKVEEVAALLDEIERVAAGKGRDVRLLVDAASGKAPVGLIAAELVLQGARHRWRVVVLERDPVRVEACQTALTRRRSIVPVEIRAGDVADPALWPEEPDLVVGLHACGAASDAIIDRATGARTRRLLLVPCCYGAAPRSRRPPAVAIPGQRVAASLAEALEIPRHALVGRAFARALIDAERTLRLEAAGYETEVVELVSPRVTPFNLLWRARRVRQPQRSRAAADRLARLRGSGP